MIPKSKWIKTFLAAPRGTKVSFLGGFTILLFILVLAIFPQYLATHDPLTMTLNYYQPPGFQGHLFGTDRLGRDVYSRVIYGTQISTGIGMLAVSLAAIIGSTFGCLVGYLGGTVDKLLTFFVDALYAFPILLVSIIVAIIIGPSPQNTAIAVAVALIPRYYRVIRSVSLSVKSLPFIEATRAMGASHLYIAFKHVFPLTISSIVVLTSLNMGEAILVVAGLGFLGLGIPPPISEWGTDISINRPAFGLGVLGPVAFPALMIFITCTSLSLLGESLNTMLNPKIYRF